jgi:hypothetical protein
MEGLIHHTLKGIKGWSFLSISTIDIYKVKEICYKKRLFCVFDRKHPYTLTIEYNEPQKRFTIAPGMCVNGFYTMVLTYYETSISLITKRYQTKDEIENEINEIKLQQQKMELFKNQLRNKINKMK